jgi:Mycothiol maleylpyruvate isomerase N-terminal domain
MATKRELVEADDRAWALFLGTVESLSGEQLVEPGYFADEGWSVKDLIAHIAFWMTIAANKLEEMRLGSYRPGDTDTEALNKEGFEANKDMPLPIVRAECYSAHTRMLQELDALPEVDREAEEWFAESADVHCGQHQPRLDEWAAELRARAGA